jgi:poly(beta-D-mannuronate) lyase
MAGRWWHLSLDMGRSITALGLVLLGCARLPAADWPSAERWPPPDFVEGRAPACQRTLPVPDAAALPAALAGAGPGDCLELADGDYSVPVISRSGAAGRPLVIRAARRGRAVVNAGDLIVRGAAHLVIEGLLFTSDGNIQIRDAQHVRLTRCRIRPREKPDLDWVVVETSHHVRIDHNDFGPKEVVGNMVMLEGDQARKQVVQFNRIDHNHFHDIKFGGGNGWEAIRAGRSWLAPSRAFTVIEHNLFSNTGGDPEVVSIKSSDNVVRYNTMRASAGQFTLRHGNRNLVYGNHILGMGRERAGGIRVYGADHRIFDNYVAGVRPGILLDAGSRPETDQPGTAHYRVYRAEVVNNTLVDARIQVGGSKALPPVDCLVANNRLQGGGIDLGGLNTRYTGNLTAAGPGAAAASPAPPPRPVPAPSGPAPASFSPGSPESAASSLSGGGPAPAPPAFENASGDDIGPGRDQPDLVAGHGPPRDHRRAPLTPDQVGPDAP